MKNSLWIVIVITAAFLGFLMGYSVPPLIETGMIGGQSGQTKGPRALQKDTEQYYRDLHKD